MYFWTEDSQANFFLTTAGFLGHICDNDGHTKVIALSICLLVYLYTNFNSSKIHKNVRSLHHDRSENTTSFLAQSVVK